ncbi:putative Ubiquitin carboxyl-terminal hydrolase 3 [Blattamonas nauphoetae]|uniref:Ubiquitin carboxyl-terminal hydrolase n=1 Tax=Blattamonas nauphoetae TaxID=2049346 RepID=A0ABQ9XQQ6_9EUKA|nr:putative Ubiquitin carboxyl-terminal hydrolase 3 [Blattamonas nauphoetae]
MSPRHPIPFPISKLQMAPQLNALQTSYRPLLNGTDTELHAPPDEMLKDHDSAMPTLQTTRPSGCDNSLLDSSNHDNTSGISRVDHFKSVLPSPNQITRAFRDNRLVQLLLYMSTAAVSIDEWTAYEHLLENPSLISATLQIITPQTHAHQTVQPAVPSKGISSPRISTRSSTRANQSATIIQDVVEIPDSPTQPNETPRESAKEENVGRHGTRSVRNSLNDEYIWDDLGFPPLEHQKPTEPASETTQDNLSSKPDILRKSRQRQQSGPGLHDVSELILGEENIDPLTCKYPPLTSFVSRIYLRSLTRGQNEAGNVSASLRTALLFSALNSYESTETTTDTIPPPLPFCEGWEEMYPRYASAAVRKQRLPPSFFDHTDSGASPNRTNTASVKKKKQLKKKSPMATSLASAKIQAMLAPDKAPLFDSTSIKRNRRLSNRRSTPTPTVQPPSSQSNAKSKDGTSSDIRSDIMFSTPLLPSVFHTSISVSPVPQEFGLSSSPLTKPRSTQSPDSILTYSLHTALEKGRYDSKSFLDAAELYAQSQSSHASQHRPNSSSLFTSYLSTPSQPARTERRATRMNGSPVHRDAAASENNLAHHVPSPPKDGSDSMLLTPLFKTIRKRKKKLREASTEKEKGKESPIITSVVYSDQLHRNPLNRISSSAITSHPDALRISTKMLLKERKWDKPFIQTVSAESPMTIGRHLHTGEDEKEEEWNVDIDQTPILRAPSIASFPESTPLQLRRRLQSSMSGLHGRHKQTHKNQHAGRKKPEPPEPEPNLSPPRVPKKAKKKKQIVADDDEMTEYEGSLWDHVSGQLDEDDWEWKLNVGNVKKKKKRRKTARHENGRTPSPHRNEEDSDTSSPPPLPPSPQSHKSNRRSRRVLVKDEVEPVEIIPTEETLVQTDKSVKKRKKRLGRAPRQPRQDVVTVSLFPILDFEIGREMSNSDPGRNETPPCQVPPLPFRSSFSPVILDYEKDRIEFRIKSKRNAPSSITSSQSQSPQPSDPSHLTQRSILSRTDRDTITTRLPLSILSVQQGHPQPRLVKQHSTPTPISTLQPQTQTQPDKTDKTPNTPPTSKTQRQPPSLTSEPTSPPKQVTPQPINTRRTRLFAIQSSENLSRQHLMTPSSLLAQTNDTRFIFENVETRSRRRERAEKEQQQATGIETINAEEPIDTKTEDKDKKSTPSKFVVKLDGKTVEVDATLSSDVNVLPSTATPLLVSLLTQSQPPPTNQTALTPVNPSLGGVDLTPQHQQLLELVKGEELVIRTRRQRNESMESSLFDLSAFDQSQKRKKKKKAVHFDTETPPNAHTEEKTRVATRIRKVTSRRSQKKNVSEVSSAKAEVEIIECETDEKKNKRGVVAESDQHSEAQGMLKDDSDNQTIDTKDHIPKHEDPKLEEGFELKLEEKTLTSVVAPAVNVTPPLQPNPTSTDNTRTPLPVTRISVIEPTPINPLAHHSDDENEEEEEEEDEDNSKSDSIENTSDDAYIQRHDRCLSLILREEMRENPSLMKSRGADEEDKDVIADGKKRRRRRNTLFFDTDSHSMEEEKSHQKKVKGGQQNKTKAQTAPQNTNTDHPEPLPPIQKRKRSSAQKSQRTSSNSNDEKPVPRSQIMKSRLATGQPLQLSPMPKKTRTESHEMTQTKSQMGEKMKTGVGGAGVLRSRQATKLMRGLRGVEGMREMLTRLLKIEEMKQNQPKTREDADVVISESNRLLEQLSNSTCLYCRRSSAASVPRTLSLHILPPSPVSSPHTPPSIDVEKVPISPVKLISDSLGEWVTRLACPPPLKLSPYLTAKMNLSPPTRDISKDRFVEFLFAQSLPARQQITQEQNTKNAVQNSRGQQVATVGQAKDEKYTLARLFSTFWAERGGPGQIHEILRDSLKNTAEEESEENTFSPLQTLDSSNILTIVNKSHPDTFPPGILSVPTPHFPTALRTLAMSQLNTSQTLVSLVPPLKSPLGVSPGQPIVPTTFSLSWSEQLQQTQRSLQGLHPLHSPALSLSPTFGSSGYQTHLQNLVTTPKMNVNIANKLIQQNVTGTTQTASSPTTLTIPISTRPMIGYTQTFPSTSLIPYPIQQERRGTPNSSTSPPRALQKKDIRSSQRIVAKKQKSQLFGSTPQSENLAPTLPAMNQHPFPITSQPTAFPVHFNSPNQARRVLSSPSRTPSRIPPSTRPKRKTAQKKMIVDSDSDGNVDLTKSEESSVGYQSSSERETRTRRAWRRNEDSLYTPETPRRFPDSFERSPEKLRPSIPPHAHPILPSTHLQTSPNNPRQNNRYIFSASNTTNVDHPLTKRIKAKSMWLPLESNPDVLNSYCHSIGLPEEYQFNDVYGLDEELLAMVPPNVKAVFCLFPWEGPKYVPGPIIDDKKPFFIAQLPEIGDACGTIAVLNALGNLQDQITFHPDSFLSSFLGTATTSMTPEEKCSAIMDDKQLEESHHIAVSQGQSRVPEGGVTHSHFISFVNVNGHLLEFDGLREGPVDHGESSPENILADSAKAIQDRINNSKDQLNFGVTVLNHVEEAPAEAE